MRRLLRKLTFVPVMLILAGFVVFTVVIAQPLRSAEKRDLVRGTVRGADALRPDGPFTYYVALHPGPPVDPGEAPEFALDDVQPEGDGRFELSADAGDGSRFYLLARVETAKLERFCEVVELPGVRWTEDGWVTAATGEPTAQVAITVDRKGRC